VKLHHVGRQTVVEVSNERTASVFRI